MYELPPWYKAETFVGAAISLASPLSILPVESAHVAAEGLLTFHYTQGVISRRGANDMRLRAAAILVALTTPLGVNPSWFHVCGPDVWSAGLGRELSRVCAMAPTHALYVPHEFGSESDAPSHAMLVRPDENAGLLRCSEDASSPPEPLEWRGIHRTQRPDGSAEARHVSGARGVMRLLSPDPAVHEAQCTAIRTRQPAYGYVRGSMFSPNRGDVLYVAHPDGSVDFDVTNPEALAEASRQRIAREAARELELGQQLSIGEAP